MFGLTIADFLVFLSVTIIAIYFYLRRNHNYWSKRGVPSTSPTIIVGNAGPSLMMKRQFGQLINDVYEKFGGHKVAGFYNFGCKPMLVVRDPELLYKIYVTDFHSFRNNDADIDPEADPVSARNIFMQKDEMWKKSRALITPAFTVGKIKPTFNKIESISRLLVDHLKKQNGDILLKPVLSRYTAEIAATCGFGVEGNCFTEDKPMIHEIGQEIFEPNFINGIKFLLFLSIPSLAKLLKVRFVSQKAVDFFDKVLRDVIEYRQKSGSKTQDLLSYWIDLKYKSIEVEKGNVKSDLVSKTFSDDDVLSGCVTFFIETYESTAWSMNNMLYLLAINPDAQKRLQEEVDEAVEKSKDITYEMISELPYMNCVMLESLRYMPIAYSFAKRCTEEYTMELDDGKKLLIEPGTSIGIPFYSLARDPKYWDKPEDFNPDRFANGDPSPKGVFIPFGIGPRMCIGMRAAVTNMKVGVFNIMRELNVLPAQSTPKVIDQDPQCFFLKHKNGIYLKFETRNK